MPDSIPDEDSENENKDKKVICILYNILFWYPKYLWLVYRNIRIATLKKCKKVVWIFLNPNFPLSVEINQRPH